MSRAAIAHLCTEFRPLSGDINVRLDDLVKALPQQVLGVHKRWVLTLHRRQV